MKAFAFSMERMRQYKTQLLNKEKDTLAKLRQEKLSIETKIQHLNEYRALKQVEFRNKQQQGITAQEITSYQFYFENSIRLIDEYNKELKIADEKVEKQMKVVILASQEISGLDKLEEKQLEEYRYLEAKEYELQIAELVSSKVIRQQSEYTM